MQRLASLLLTGCPAGSMKVKAINRSETECARERRQDLQKVHKNLDPALHPFEKAVEYTRALNAAKLDRRAPRRRSLGTPAVACWLGYLPRRWAAR